MDIPGYSHWSRTSDNSGSWMPIIVTVFNQY